MKISRRTALKSMGLGLASLNIPVWAQVKLVSGFPYASSIQLVGPDRHGFMLPEGFASRIVAETGKAVENSNYKWHWAPDGGAVVPTSDGGWIYVSNSESIWSFSNPNGGGVGAIRFDSQGVIQDAYSLLTGTVRNCAGGMTPWGSWLSCEEFDVTGQDPEMLSNKVDAIAGRVWETFPLEPNKEAVVHPAMGLFQHEAVAYDEKGYFYLTEDQKDGKFYRFIPEIYGDLSRGDLQVAMLNEEKIVTWQSIEDPQVISTVPTRAQLDDATEFKGGEGCAYLNGKIYFTTKYDNRVWTYDVESKRMDVLYEASGSDDVLTGVDNLAITPAGQIAVAEDGGNLELVGVNSRGEAVPLLRLTGQDNSELAGPAFSPDGTRLYISSQRGPSGRSKGGVTYEIQGPFSDLGV